MFSQEQEKIERLQELLSSIKGKANVIASQTKFLKTFNRKMEILIACFKAYAIDDKDAIFVPEMAERKPTKEKKAASIAPTCDSQSNKDSLDTCEIKRARLSMEALIEKVFAANQIEKALANTILSLIKSREFIALDDLVKGIKSSKYKVIEVINILIKEKIIVKSYEKGFVYRISKEVL